LWSSQNRPGANLGGVLIFPLHAVAFAFTFAFRLAIGFAGLALDRILYVADHILHLAFNLFSGPFDLLFFIAGPFAYLALYSTGDVLGFSFHPILIHLFPPVKMTNVSSTTGSPARYLYGSPPAWREGVCRCLRNRP